MCLSFFFHSFRITYCVGTLQFTAKMIVWLFSVEAVEHSLFRSADHTLSTKRQNTGLFREAHIIWLCCCHYCIFVQLPIFGVSCQQRWDRKQRPFSGKQSYASPEENENPDIWMKYLSNLHMERHICGTYTQELKQVFGRSWRRNTCFSSWV